MGRDTKPLPPHLQQKSKNKEASSHEFQEEPSPQESPVVRDFFLTGKGRFILNKIITDLGALVHIMYFFSRIPFRADCELFRFSRKHDSRVQRGKEGLFLVWDSSGADLWPVLCSVPESQVSGRWLTRTASRLCWSSFHEHVLLSFPPLFLSRLCSLS